MRYLDDGIWWCLCWNWLLAVWHLAFGSNISYICKFFNPTFNTILCYSSLITGVLVFKVGKPQIYMFSNVCSFLCLSISVNKSLVFNIPVYMNMHLIILSPVFSRSSQFEILIHNPENFKRGIKRCQQEHDWNVWESLVPEHRLRWWSCFKCMHFSTK